MHDKLNAGGHKRGRYMFSETLIHIIYTSNPGSFEVDLSHCRSRKRITELKMSKTDEYYFATEYIAVKYYPHYRVKLSALVSTY